MRASGLFRLVRLGVFVAVVASLLVGMFAATAFADSDDDVPGIPLINSSASGMLTRTFDDSDVYAIYLKAGEGIYASVDSTAVNAPGGWLPVGQLTVYRPGTQSTLLSRGSARQSMDSTFSHSKIAYVAQEEGVHYLRLQLSNAVSSASYRIEWSTFQGELDDDIPGRPETSGSASGTIDGFRDPRDVYAISLHAGQKLSAILNASGAEAVGSHVDLLGPGTGTVSDALPLYPTTSQIGANYYLSYECKSDGVYYLSVVNDDLNVRSYVLDWFETLPTADDAVPGVPLGASPVFAKVDRALDEDVYRIDLAPGRLFNAYAAGVGAQNGYMELRGPEPHDGSQLWPIAYSSTVETGQELGFIPVVGGTYYLSFVSYGRLGDYSLSWGISDLAPDDSIPCDPNPASSPASGWLSSSQDQLDVRAVWLEKGQRLLASATANGSLGGQLRLYAPDASSIASPYIAYGYVNSTSLAYTASYSGLYYLSISASSGRGDYVLTWEILSNPDDQLPGRAIAGTTVSDSLAPPRDSDDVYQVLLEKGKQTTFSISGPTSNASVNIQVFSPSSTSIESAPIASWYRYSSGVAGSFTPLETGLYSVRVSAWNPVAYSLSWAKSPVADDDIPGVSLPASGFTGNIDPNEICDVYSIHLSQGEKFTWDCGTSASGSLYGPGSQSTDTTRPLNGKSVVAFATGDYYLKVTGSVGAYRVNWSKSSPEPNDEVGGVPLPSSRVFESLTSTDKVDVYAVSLRRGELISLEASGTQSSNLTLNVFGPGTHDVASAVPLTSASGRLKCAADTDGVYYVMVTGERYSGEYLLEWKISQSDGDDTAPGLAMPSSTVTDSVDAFLDPSDFRWIDLQPGETFSANVSSNSYIGVYLRRQDGTWVEDSLPDGLNNRICYTASQGGRYYLAIQAYATNAYYQLSTSVTTSPEPFDDDLPGIPLQLGQTIGHFEKEPDGDSPVQERDVYSIYLEQGSTLRVDMSAYAPFVDLYLVTPGAPVDSPFRVGGPPLLYTAPVSGEYHIVAQPYWGDGQSVYSLEASVSPPEARPDIPGAPLESSVLSGTSDFGDPLSDRVVSFDLKAGETLVASLSPANGYCPDAAIFGPDATSVRKDVPAGVWFGSNSERRIVYKAVQSGRHYLWLRPQWGSWSLNWSVWRGEADDSIPGIALVSPTVSADLDSSFDPDDIYRVELAKGMSVSASLTGPTGSDYRAALFGPNVGSLEATQPLSETPASTYPRTANWTAPASGTYYLRVHAASGGGLYTLGTTVHAAPVDPAAPEILGTRPTPGTRLGLGSTPLQTAVSEGAPPLNVEFQVSTGADTWASLGAAAQEGPSYYGITLWTLKSWNKAALPEGPLYVRTVATDGLNRSVCSTAVAYVLDKTAPETPTGLSATSTTTKVDLHWDSVVTSDLAGYRLLRREVGGEWLTICNTTSTHWIDSTAHNGTSYEYALRSIDKADNVSPVSDPFAISLVLDVTSPHVDAGPSQEAYAGQTVVLDGSLSSDESGISSYIWDYGDGSTGSGAVSTHSYAVPGTYQARLTARDTLGNESSDTATVTVKPLDSGGAGTVVVTVGNGGGFTLAGASVALEDVGGTKLLATTDGRGVATFTVEPGSWVAYAYGTDYLPGKASFSVEPAQRRPIRIELTKGELLIGEVKTERLTPQQITAHNIDVTDPANQWVTKFTISWGLHELTGFVQGPSGEGTGTLYVPPTPRSPGENISYSTILVDGTPSLSYVLVSGEVAWLREIFDVTCTLTNAASDPKFELTDTVAEIALPGQVSLAPKMAPAPQQTARVQVGSIPAGGAKTVSWQLRGDAAGECTPTVHVTTLVQPFGKVLDKTFSGKPIKVYGRGAVTTMLTYPRKVTKGNEFVLRATARNMTPYDVYLVKARLTRLDNATVVGGLEASEQSTPSIQPDGTWMAEWRIMPEASGTFSGVQNEGDISAWIRTSDLDGDEVVVPYLPELGSEETTIEAGGTMLRYYRTVEPLPASGDRKGVWFVDATATIDVTVDGELRSRETSVIVNNEYPSGVFAIPISEFQSAGDKYQVRLRNLHADDKYDFDMQALPSFGGVVSPRSGVERTFKEGSKLGLSLSAIVKLSTELEQASAYTLTGDDNVTTDIDYSAKAGVGVSAKLFDVGYELPVVGSAKAKVGADASFGVTALTGFSSEYPTPLTNDDAALALALNVLDMRTMNQRAAGLTVLEPMIMAYKTALEAVLVDPKMYRTRNMAGAGVWGKASGKAGAEAQLGKVELDGHSLLGAELNLADTSGEFATDLEFIGYPKTHECGIKFIDRMKSSSSFLALKAYAGPEKTELAAFEDKLDGAVQVETIFDVDRIKAAVNEYATHGTTYSASDFVNRVEVTVDDPEKNVTQVFTLDTESLGLQKHLRKDGNESKSFDVVMSLISAMEAEKTGGGTFNTGATAGFANVDLLRLCNKAEQYGGPKPDKHSIGIGASLKALGIGGDVKDEESWENSARNLQDAGVLRESLFYPLAHYTDEPKNPTASVFADHLDKILRKAIAHVGPAVGEKIKTTVSQVGSFISCTVKSVGDVIQSPFGAARMSIAALETNADQIDIEVPAGAVSQDTSVTINALPETATADWTDASGRSVNGGLTLLGAIRVVSPDLTLSVPATLTAGWDQARSGDIAWERIGLWEFTEQGWDRISLPISEYFQSVETTTSHLGSFVVGADMTAPTVTFSSPAASETISALQPWVIFSAGDSASRLDTATVAVLMDGEFLPSQVATDGLVMLQAPLLNEGPHTIEVTAKDRVGNEARVVVPFTIDRTAPQVPAGLTVEQSGENAELTWTEVPDADASYRIYRRSGEQTTLAPIAQTSGNHFTDPLPPGGKSTYYAVSARDGAGNESTVTYAPTFVARYGATAHIEASQDDQFAHVTTLLEADGHPIEGQSYAIEKSLDGQVWSLVSDASQEDTSLVTSLPRPIDTTWYRIRFDGSPAWQPCTAVTSIAVAPDLDPPVTSATGFTSTWTSETVTLRFSATDRSGVKSTHLTRNGEVVEYADPYVVDSEGVNLIEYWSVDVKDNVERKNSDVVRIDRTPPSMSVSQTVLPNGSARIEASATDTYSGVRSIRHSIDGGPWLDGREQTVAISGDHQVRFLSDDFAGNESSTTVAVSVQMVTPPVEAPAIGSVITEEPTAAVTWTGVSRADQYEIELNGSVVASTYALSAELSSLTPGVNILRVRAVNAGGAGPWAETTVTFVAPALLPDLGAARSVSTRSYSLVWPAVAHANRYEVEVNGTISARPAISAASISLTQATNVVRVRAGNAAGFGDWSSVSIAYSAPAPPSGGGDPAPVDQTPPHTDIFGPTSGWSQGPVTVTLTAKDDVDSNPSIYYRIGDGAPSLYSVPFSVSAEGTTSISYWSVDASKHSEEPVVVAVRIDNSAPTVEIGRRRGAAPFEIEALDALSGVALIRHRTDGGVWTTGTAVAPASVGTHTVDVVAADNAGNQASITLPVVVTARANLSLKASSTTVSYPSSVRLSGSLSTTSALSVTGAMVSIEASSASGWIRVGGSLVAEDGRFGLSVCPRVATIYRAVLTDAGSLDDAASSSVRVLVRAKLATPKASDSTPRRLRTFYVSGSVAPAHPARIKLSYYRLYRRTWRFEGYKWVSANENGSYRVGFKLGAGTYRFRSSHSDAGHVANTSGYSSSVSVR